LLLDNLYRGLFQLHTCLAICWSLHRLTRLQVLYNLTLLYGVITSFMFTHVCAFYTPFINTATIEQRENNELSDGQVLLPFTLLLICRSVWGSVSRANCRIAGCRTEVISALLTLYNVLFFLSEI